MSSCGTCATSSPSPRSCTSRAPRAACRHRPAADEVAIARIEQQVGVTCSTARRAALELDEPAGTARAHQGRCAPSRCDRRRRSAGHACWRVSVGLSSASGVRPRAALRRRARAPPARAPEVGQQSTRPLLEAVRPATRSSPSASASGIRAGSAAAPQGRADVRAVGRHARGTRHRATAGCGRTPTGRSTAPKGTTKHRCAATRGERADRLPPTSSRRSATAWTSDLRVMVRRGRARLRRPSVSADRRAREHERSRDRDGRARRGPDPRSHDARSARTPHRCERGR